MEILKLVPLEDISTTPQEEKQYRLKIRSLRYPPREESPTPEGPTVVEVLQELVELIKAKRDVQLEPFVNQYGQEVTIWANDNLAYNGIHKVRLSVREAYDLSMLLGASSLAEDQEQSKKLYQEVVKALVKKVSTC